MEHVLEDAQRHALDRGRSSDRNFDKGRNGFLCEERRHGLSGGLSALRKAQDEPLEFDEAAKSILSVEAPL